MKGYGIHSGRLEVIDINMCYAYHFLRSDFFFLHKKDNETYILNGDNGMECIKMSIFAFFPHYTCDYCKVICGYRQK